MSNVKSYEGNIDNDVNFGRREHVTDSDFPNQYSDLTSSQYTNVDTPQSLYPLNRTPDSTDDFEHLEHELEMQMQNNNNKQRQADSFTNLLSSLDNSNDFQNQPQNLVKPLEDRYLKNQMTKNDSCDLDPLPATPPPSADLENLSGSQAMMLSLSELTKISSNEDVNQVNFGTLSLKPTSSIAESRCKNLSRSKDSFLDKEDYDSMENLADITCDNESQSFMNNDRFDKDRSIEPILIRPIETNLLNFEHGMDDSKFIVDSIDDLDGVSQSIDTKETRSYELSETLKEHYEIKDNSFGEIKKGPMDDIYSSEKQKAEERSPKKFHDDFSLTGNASAPSSFNEVDVLPHGFLVTSEDLKTMHYEHSNDELKSESSEIICALLSLYSKWAMTVIYWHNPKQSGTLLTSLLFVLLALSYFSVISVLAYLLLLMLFGMVSMRIYRSIMQSIQKTRSENSFINILDADLSLSSERIHELIDLIVPNINAGIIELRRLLMVEDLFDSIKFGIILWTLTYVGAWFNGMTLIILGLISIFTLPKIYKKNRQDIDKNLTRFQQKIIMMKEKTGTAIFFGKKNISKDK